MSSGFSKRALVVIQGISKCDSYMHLPVVSSIYKLFSAYDKVVYVKSEDAFDSTFVSAFLDKWDFIPFFTNKGVRKKIQREFNKSLIDLNADGYDIDVVAHSLGCVIALTEDTPTNVSIKVNTCYLLQSPANNNLYGWFVRRFIRRNPIKGVKYGQILKTWNKGDNLVANSKVDCKYISRSISNVVNQFEAGKGHNWLIAISELMLILGIDEF